MIDWSRCKTAPYAHQKTGTLKLIEEPCFALFDQVGAGKTKQVVDGACFLSERGQIDAVIVVAPANVRSVSWGAVIGFALGRSSV